MLNQIFAPADVVRINKTEHACDGEICPSRTWEDNHTEWGRRAASRRLAGTNSYNYPPMPYNDTELVNISRINGFNDVFAGTLLLIQVSMLLC